MHWDVIVPRSRGRSPVACRLLPSAKIERMPEAPANASTTGSGWNGWTAVVLLVSLPFVVTLCLILWRTPVPLTEAVAIFEDVAQFAPTKFLVPDTSYYRPVFYFTVSAIWHSVGALDMRLALIKLVQIGAVTALVALLVLHVRPRRLLEAVAAAAAVAVLVGSPGFQDNLEIPLSYTTVGMPIGLGVLMLLERRATWLHGPLLVGLTLIAVGFKEQGLVVVPVVLVAWRAGAPGVTRSTAGVLAAMATAYVVVRLVWRQKGLPLFEQAIGLGFTQMEPSEAAARYGAFPYGIYAYNGMATILNVLFSEPTRGMFRLTRLLLGGALDWWCVIQFTSSAAVTALIGGRGVRVLREAARSGWTREARVYAALVVALLACGVLSFNYSRDRLGGMALVFYAVAAYHALHAALTWAAQGPRPRAAAAGVALMTVIAMWQTRTFTTLEYARYTADVIQRQWLTMLPERRREFAARPTYLGIMDSMVDQGTDPSTAHRTQYSARVNRLLGLP
jgi:hypothetical protein